MIPLLHDAKADIMGERDDDSYYLDYIGTKPNARRKGYASKLIMDMMHKVEKTTTSLSMIFGTILFC